MMRAYLTLMAMTALLGGCHRDDVSSVASTCYPDVNASRSKRIMDVAVTTQASGGLAIGFQLVTTDGTALSACNLPDEFKRDGLAIYVSGYSLTWPELALMNLTPIPFEVTEARLR